MYDKKGEYIYTDRTERIEKSYCETQIILIVKVRGTIDSDRDKHSDISPMQSSIYIHVEEKRHAKVDANQSHFY